MSLITPSIVSLALHALNGEAWEQRQRSVGGKLIGERCVVTLPDNDAVEVMAFVVQAAGGTIEGNPAQLAGGMRLPETGVLLSFSFPANAATFTSPPLILDIP